MSKMFRLRSATIVEILISTEDLHRAVHWLEETCDEMLRSRVVMHLRPILPDDEMERDPDHIEHLDSKVSNDLTLHRIASNRHIASDTSYMASVMRR